MRQLFIPRCHGDAVCSKESYCPLYSAGGTCITAGLFLLPRSPLPFEPCVADKGIDTHETAGQMVWRWQMSKPGSR